MSVKFFEQKVGTEQQPGLIAKGCEHLCSDNTPQERMSQSSSFFPPPRPVTATMHLGISSADSHANNYRRFCLYSRGETSVISYHWFALGGAETEQHQTVGSSLRLGINPRTRVLVFASSWFTSSPLIPEGISPTLTRCYAVPYGPPHKGYQKCHTQH